MKLLPTRRHSPAVALLIACVLLSAAAESRAQVPGTLQHSIAAPPVGAQSGALLGYTVAVDGNLTVVGAPYDDIQGLDSGVVKVFDSSSGALLHVIPNPSAAPNDQFGYSVAISGTRMVVGARSDDTGAQNAGSAYVYDLSSGTPTMPVATLNNPGPAVEDQFGYSVAISGTRVVVGAWLDDTGMFDAGSAYVYDLSSGSPMVPVATLNNPGPAANDWFGISVAISGTRVVVGASRDDTGATDTGSAYVYDLSSGTPAVPVATLNNPGPAPSDEFGSSVAISGTRVVVGAALDNAGATDAGSAYVYDLSSGTPAVPVATLNNPAPAASDQFGFPVAMSGTRVVVGARLDDTGASNAGSAYVYNLTSGTPTVPVTTLNNPGPATSDQFGFSVAISGTRMVVGTPVDDTGATDAGSAYVYDLSSGTPAVPVATLNNPARPRVTNSAIRWRSLARAWWWGRVSTTPERRTPGARMCMIWLVARRQCRWRR
jgi:sulfur relay (sulfurtransferase) DsrC/TusE family protein